MGGGPGGYTAAMYLARGGFSVVVLEKLAPGGQMAATGLVDNYPGFEDGIDGFELGRKMEKGAARFGAQTSYAEVTRLELTGPIKRLVTTTGELTARTVVLAPGAYPRELGLPEEKGLRGRGVAYCATCDGNLYKGQAVAVVGGGNSAAADAVYLAKLCRKVYLIHRRDSLRASRAYLRPLMDSGVEFVWNSRVTKLLHGEKVTGVLIENTQGGTREIALDGVFIAIGRVPDTQPLQGLVDLNEQGYIVADETTRTSIPGVFAVGDARTKPLRQIVTATADGAVASHFIEAYLSKGGQ